MKKGYTKLLEIISNGNVYSGQDLAASLNVSRAAIWKSIKHLQALGLEIRAIRGKGYQLLEKFEFLSKEEIRSMMTSKSKKSCKDIGVVFKTNSTNSYLLNQLDNESIHGSVVFAEYQLGGRGRRNKKWISPIGSGICFSVGWRFEVMPISLGLLSLYMGIAIARSLNSLKIKEVGLKWPNDIVMKSKKIGGILVEKEWIDKRVKTIIGIGINLDIQNIENNNYSLALLDNEIRNTNLLLAIEKLNNKPSLDLTTSVEYSDTGRIDSGTEKTNGTIGLTLTIPIFQKNNDKSDIRKYQSKLLQSELTFEDAKQDFGIQASNLYKNYLISKSNTVSYTHLTLPTNREV